MVSPSTFKQKSPRAQLRQRLKAFFRTDFPRLTAAEKAKLIRIQVSLKPLDPLTWLAHQTADIKTYWSDREGQFVMAGVGAADMVHGQSAPGFAAILAGLQQRLPADAPTRYYGGFSFRPTAPQAEPWQAFGTYRWVVPQFEVYAAAGHTYLACNLWLPETDPDQQLRDLLNTLDQLVFRPVSRPCPLPPVMHRQDLPDQAGWRHMLQGALHRLSTDQLAKVVLARQSRFTLCQPLEPLSLLLAMQPGPARLFQFCFQPQASLAFVGASPERLYRRRGRLLQTEAIAGTRPRGASSAADQALGAALLRSEKDHWEHRLVVRSLRAALSQVCQLVGLDRAPSLLKLSQVQHLHTACNGILMEGITDGEILPLLHPTPAVGGYPKQPAREAIEHLEPFERGWYAAPVGWVSHAAADFAVAIRSGLVNHHQLALFSGAGIVAGSNPDDEWQEIDHKLRAFTTVLKQARGRDQTAVSHPSNLTLVATHHDP